MDYFPVQLGTTKTVWPRDYWLFTILSGARLWAEGSVLCHNVSNVPSEKYLWVLAQTLTIKSLGWTNWLITACWQTGCFAHVGSWSFSERRRPPPPRSPPPPGPRHPPLNHVNHLQANQQSTWWSGYGECSMLRWCSGREEHGMSFSSSMTLDNPVDVLRHQVRMPDSLALKIRARRFPCASWLVKGFTRISLVGQAESTASKQFDDELLSTVSLQSWKEEKRFTFCIDLTSVVDLGCSSWIGVAPSRILGRKIPDLNPHKRI
jgi:hypothetical protein